MFATARISQAAYPASWRRSVPTCISSGNGNSKSSSAMRTGVDPYGHEIGKQMPWHVIGRMSEDDLRALYEYLGGSCPRPEYRCEGTGTRPTNLEPILTGQGICRSIRVCCT